VHKNTIIIAGDSWAAGSWDKHELEIPRSKEGTAQNFIEAGYCVRNLAKPGGSNLESVSRVKDYLRFNQEEIDDIKFVLFWQTEFFREISYYLVDDDMLQQELDLGYRRLKDHWVYRPYHELSKISQQWQVPIYVVGGCSDCVWYDEFEKGFPGVKVACQSLTNLLVTGDHRTEDPVFCQFMSGWIDKGNFLSRVRRNIASHDLQILLSDIALGEQRMNTYLQNPEFFSPDGIHPNGHAHHTLFVHLMQTIPELVLDQKIA